MKGQAMGASKSQRRGRKRACPICAMPAVAAYRPFCSARCAEVDLGRWLTGRYRIPTAEPPDDFSQASPDGAEVAAPGDSGEDRKPEET